MGSNIGRKGFLLAADVAEGNFMKLQFSSFAKNISEIRGKNLLITLNQIYSIIK